MATSPTTENDSSENRIITCIKCPEARFPKPNEQCYKFGGLICQIDGENVGKYDKCRFGYDAGQLNY